jgi:hypothetical protein
MSDLETTLDRLVPEPAAEGDWDRVLADARRPTRRRLALAVPVAALAAAVAVVVLAWPSTSKPPTVLDYALAAVGDGPVIHVVTRGPWGSSVVNLETGEVKQQFSEYEQWLDPSRGVRTIARLGGQVTGDYRIPRRAAGRSIEQYRSLLNHYREELRSGKAKVIGPGKVDGRPVLWIRLRGQWLDDTDGYYHLFAQEVAVDRSTYEPLYSRFTRDGREPLGGGELFLKLETLPAGEGNLDAKPAPRGKLYAGAESARPVTFDELRDLFGAPAIWLGPTYAGRPLVEKRKLLFKDKQRKEDDWNVVPAATLFYGELRPLRGGIRLREDTKPFVLLTEAKTKAPMWRAAYNALDLPEGFAQVDVTGAVFLRTNGLYVSVNAKPRRDAIAAALALRPYGTAAPPPTSLDVDRIIREVEARKGQQPVVEGGAPVRPRPVVRPGAAVVQTGSGAGVTARVYENGGVTLDFTRLDPDLRPLVKSQVTVGCIKTPHPPESIGGRSVPYRPRITTLVLGHFQRGRPPRPIKPLFDACEVGLGVGRNWWRRTEGHGLVEIPLTDAGRRWFDRRAAERLRNTP